MAYDEDSTMTLEGWRQEDAAAGDWERVLRITAELTARTGSANGVHDCPVCGDETRFFPTCPLRACIVQHHVAAGTIAMRPDGTCTGHPHRCNECPPDKSAPCGRPGIDPNGGPLAEQHVDAGTIAEGRRTMDHAENNPPVADAEENQFPGRIWTRSGRVVCWPHGSVVAMASTEGFAQRIVDDHNKLVAPPEDPPQADTQTESPILYGNKVRFVRPNAGYDHDKENAEMLTVNEVYAVRQIVVHGYSTTVYLQDFPGTCFNSVQFDNV